MLFVLYNIIMMAILAFVYRPLSLRVTIEADACDCMVIEQHYWCKLDRKVVQ